MARRVPLRDTSQAIETIRQDGGVILTGFASTADVANVNADAAKYLTAILQDQKSRNLPPTTARVTRLFGRSETAREVWLQQQSLHEILKYFLRTVSHHPQEVASDPILSAAATLDIPPGVAAQGLHRDDFIWHQAHRGVEVYEQGRDVGIGLLVPGVKTTVENGATLFVPGSHLWEHEREPVSEKVEAAEMDVGEAFLFLASTRHAGGANATSDVRRTVHGFFFCRAFIRPEENQFLWFKKAEVEKWSHAAQKQAGYIIDTPYLGYCDDQNPIDLFRASVGVEDGTA